MAITFTALSKPINPQVVDPSTGRMREEWSLYFDQLTRQLNGAVGELGVDYAPNNGEYIVGALNGILTAERLATDTTTVGVDLGTPGQAKWNVLEVPGIAATGLTVRTAAATYTARTLTGPAAGISVSNGSGVSGNPTLALANDLSAIEALASTGFAARTGSDTWAQRTITAGAGISVSNGDGVSGNPTITLSAIPSGTLMLFQQTSAPTGWTKDTTHNNKALRVVSGTASSGGTTAFTTVFASRTPTGTVGATTLTIAQIPLHGHPFRTSSNASGNNQGGMICSSTGPTNRAAFTGTPSNTIGQQIGGEGGGGSHDHTFTGSALDFAVQYVDLIIASKD